MGDGTGSSNVWEYPWFLRKLNYTKESKVKPFHNKWGGWIIIQSYQSHRVDPQSRKKMRIIYNSVSVKIDSYTTIHTNRPIAYLTSEATYHVVRKSTVMGKLHVHPFTTPCTAPVFAVYSDRNRLYQLPHLLQIHRFRKALSHSLPILKLIQICVVIFKKSIVFLFKFHHLIFKLPFDVG